MCKRGNKSIKEPFPHPQIIINRKDSTHYLRKVSAKEKQETPEEMKWEMTTEQAATSLSSPPQKVSPQNLDEVVERDE